MSSSQPGGESERPVSGRAAVFPEYERAASEFLWFALNELMSCRDDFLAMLPKQKTNDVPRSPQSSEGDIGSFRPLHVQCTFVQPHDAVLTVDTDQWVEMVYDAAGEAVDSLVPQIFSHLDEITAATGQVVQMNGPLTADGVLDMLDKMQLSFDEDGEPEAPTAVVPPKVMEQIRRMPPPTPEQQARMEDIYRRKKQEFDARRRVRKLDQDS